MNCAQSVLNAFKDRFPVDKETADLFAGYGSGRAPEGHCGAFYAAKVILEKYCPEKLAHFETTFSSVAGSTKCKEIRNIRRLSCAECVEKAAEYLENIR